MSNQDEPTEETLVEEDQETPLPESLEIEQPTIDVGADPDEGLTLPGRGA